MKKYTSLLLATAFVHFVFGMAAFAPPRPCDLTVEWRSAPVGIDASAPRLAWTMAAKDGADGEVQTAWRVQAATSREALLSDAPDMWDSGKKSSSSTAVEWSGAPLPSSTRIWWRVKTWNRAGEESPWSAPSSWVTGLMAPSDWKAKWIGPNAETRRDADLGGAQWIWTAPGEGSLASAPAGVSYYRVVFDFAGDPAKDVVPVVHMGTEQHEIVLNGKSFHKWSGHVNDWRWPYFRNMAPWLVKGRNEMLVRVESATPGRRGFLLSARLPDGKRLETDGSWDAAVGGGEKATAWAKAAKDFSWRKARTAGKVRETPWGPEMHLRHETASPAFEKRFNVEKNVKSAFLHITGVGFYEASLNGERVGDKVLDPSPTAFDKHVLYSTYDVADALRRGENAIKVLVGHGWYDVRSIATWNFNMAPWRDFPRMIAQLEIVYEDGAKETIVSDCSWLHVASPVGYDCIREGEVQGARDPAGPDLAVKPLPAAEVPGPKGRLVAEAHPGAKVARTVAPKAIHALKDGAWMVEFPENMAGWVKMNVRGQKKGDVLSIRYDERVNADFSPATESVRDGLHEGLAFSNERADAAAGAETRMVDHHFRYTASHNVCARDAAFQTDRFVSSGADCEVYEPRFTYNGFQYVLLRGLREKPALADIKACVVHTAFDDISSFECSDPVFNSLMKMADGAYKSNFADGYPTDCPHREKNGWTGDASIASELAQYRYENTATYEKWLRDVMDSQIPSGDICCIVPTSGWGFKWGNGPAWDSALPVIAWNLWVYRDDRRVLDEIYPALVKYLAFTATKASPDGLVKHGLGDWVPVNRAHMPSTELTSSCFYLQAQEIAARIAALKGLGADVAKYEASAAKTRAAIHTKFHKGGGVYDNGGQTAQAFPLAFGVVPKDLVPAARAKLVEACEKTDGHVDMGLLGTKCVFRALSRAGRTDLAFKMLTNPTSPSPADWLRKGGTTLWEDWRSGSSRNHIMFGDFAAWAFQWLAGIRLPDGGTDAVPAPGVRAFRSLVVAPEPIDALTYAKASVKGPNGLVKSAWRQDASKFTLDVSIPPNCTAEVRLPYGGGVKKVGSGNHSFTVKR
jgi:alpha-L-rhamnosidase